MTITYRNLNQHQLELLAHKLIPLLKPGSLIFFHGDVGAGKTTFIRALIRHHANNLNLIVPSPTYTIVQLYEDLRPSIYHLDLYRLKHVDELHALGLQDFLVMGTLLVEWPDLMSKLGLVPCLSIEIKELANGKRQIELAGKTELLQR